MNYFSEKKLFWHGYCYNINANLIVGLYNKKKQKLIMRTINVYKFNELLPDAKNVALSNLKSEFEKRYREDGLRDIFSIKEKYEKIFGVDVLVKENSEDYDWFDYKDKTNSNGDNDWDIFDKKRTESLNCLATWGDYVFADVLKGYKYDFDRSYGYNVAELISAFVNEGINATEDSLKKRDIKDVADYIVENDFEFYEDGKRYIE